MNISFIVYLYYSCNKFQLNFWKHCAGDVISEAYELEYGKDCLEMHIDAVQRGERAVVIDDLVATGGTLSAAIKLLGTLRHFLHLFSAS